MAQRFQENGQGSPEGGISPLQLLEQIFQEDPQIDFIDISAQEIQDFTDIYEILTRFPNLRELNLSDNELASLPLDLSRLRYLANLNLNGNNFESFKDTVDALKSLPCLKSLFINLHLEEQVDMIMRTLNELEFLNGLKVEREILEDDGEYEEDDTIKSRSPVKEEPSEEDQEDDDYFIRKQEQQNQLKNQQQNVVNIQEEKRKSNNNTSNQDDSRAPQMQVENSLTTLETQKDNILDLDPEDLEKVAIIYDNIRNLRRKSNKMKNNSDRQLASDFDNHLKTVMGTLSNEIKRDKQPNNKNCHILRARKQLMDILVSKMSEYLKEADSQVASEIINDVAKQYGSLVDSSIHSLSQNQIINKSDDGQLRKLIQEKDQNLQDMTKEAERLNQELIHQIDQNEIMKKKYQKSMDDMKKKVRDLENENRLIKQQQLLRKSQIENQEPGPQSQSRNTMSSQQQKSIQQQQQPKPNVKAPPSNNANAKKKLTGPIGITQQRILTLKQLKDTIADMYTQKVKFDKKCEENKMPRETMEQYMYTYLNQRYGLKNLIIEWAAAIINGIKTYLREDHDIGLFGKILKNECDEEFRFIQMHVKDTLISLLKVLLKDKYPFKSEYEIGKMIDSIQNGTMEEWMWRKIIEKMYDPKDFEVLEQRFQMIMDEKKSSNKSRMGNTASKFMVDNSIQAQMLGANKKMTREEMMAIMQSKEQEKLTYHDFQKTILDFQLQEHEKFLFRFTQLFKESDNDNNGIINEDEFRDLMGKMGVVEREEEVIYLLQMVDPYNNQKMTYSEVVHLLSSHMVPIDDQNPSQTIPLLEKFVNKMGVNFQDIELEMNQRQDSDGYQQFDQMDRDSFDQDNRL